MSLLSFSDTKHVPLIIDGRKAQTTRTPRKTPIKAGDNLYVYFRSRMKKGTCQNCICKMCKKSNANSNPRDNLEEWELENNACKFWYNFFGSAIAIKVEDFDPHALSHNALEAWAKADGFKSFAEAAQWFEKVHGKNWVNLPWDIIYFKGDWLKDSEVKGRKI
jgi:hypothetical protein